MISLKKVATIVCEWEDGNRGCTEIADFSMPIDWSNDDSFVEKAFLYFMNLGWDVATIPHLCPYCAAGRPEDER